MQHSIEKTSVDIPHGALITIRIEVFPENNKGECDGKTARCEHSVDFVRGNNLNDCVKHAYAKLKEMYELFCVNIE